MSIKLKEGKCLDCNYVGPLTAGRCQSHYWAYRSKVNESKQKKEKKRSVIPVKSAKQLERDIKYAKIRKAWLPQHPHCEARVHRCQRLANQIHHKQGREGDLLFDQEKWLAVCHNCHTWITEHSAEAMEMGLSLKRNK